MKPTGRQATINQRRRERGSVLAISAFGMLAFLLATGLAVDISHFYLVKSELQNAADASALAGASALNQHDSGITKARERAIAAVNSYEFNQTPLNLTAANIRYAVNLSDFDSGGGMDEATARGAAANVRFVNVKQPGDTYPLDTKPGITAGKVRKGINARFDDYGGSQLDPAFYPPDVNVKENISYADYSAATAADPSHFQSPAHAGVDNRRLVII